MASRSPYLNHPARLASLHATHLLDTPQEIEFDRITQLAAQTLRAPVCLISLVDEHRQFFKSASGLHSPWCDTRQTPLTHSFCQHAVESRQLLRIEDARQDPRVEENRAIDEIGVIAYLGFPLMGEDGHIWGSFCVIDGQPRQWTDEDEQNVQTFAAIVAHMIDQRRSLARLRNLIEVLAHDLKNPLSGVRLISAMLEERTETLPAFCQRLVGGLAGDSQRALDLIDSVLRRASNDEGEKNPLSWVVLAECFNDLSEQFRTALESKRITFDYEIDPPNLSFLVDEWALQRILENLVSNAIKFSPSGSAVFLRASVLSESIRIEVTDWGPGFSEEDLTALYGRYSRLSARPTQGEDSTGLGLSLVKRLVDQCHAEIECLSTRGEGTTFRVAFPKV